MGLMGLLMAYHGGLSGILSGITKSTDHPSREFCYNTGPYASFPHAGHGTLAYALMDIAGLCAVSSNYPNTAHIPKINIKIPHKRKPYVPHVAVSINRGSLLWVSLP